ncbi:MAG: hypothetical protein VX899_19985 [Myxococcota bacterium]|nr:hypothetical protein [Myxococcota bacterium]
MLFWILSACIFHKADRMTLTQVSPAVLQTPDISMACTLGEASWALLPAIEDEKLRRSATFSGISAAMCSDIRTWELELERRQALYLASQSAEPEIWSTRASDIALREQRAHVEAARRHLRIFESLEAEYGPVGEACPDLADEEQLLYLMGLASGSLAVLHDGAADHALDVNQGIARAVERGAACLDSTALNGVPMALRASVWTAVPGAGPQDADPWTELETAALQGDSQGVWLARALQAQAANAAGNEDALNAAFAGHLTAMEAGGDPAYGLLNDYAHRMIRHESDRIWMDAAGTRTPSGRLGERPGAELDVDFDLDAFFGEDAAPESAPAEDPTPSEETE